MVAYIVLYSINTVLHCSWQIIFRSLGHKLRDAIISKMYQEMWLGGDNYEAEWERESDGKWLSCSENEKMDKMKNARAPAWIREKPASEPNTPLSHHLKWQSSLTTLTLTIYISHESNMGKLQRDFEQMIRTEYLMWVTLQPRTVPYFPMIKGPGAYTMSLDRLIMVKLRRCPWCSQCLLSSYDQLLWFMAVGFGHSCWEAEAWRRPWAGDVKTVAGNKDWQTGNSKTPLLILLKIKVSFDLWVKIYSITYLTWTSALKGACFSP